MSKPLTINPPFFVSGVTLLFIYLEMTGQIHWGWVSVLSPMLFDVAVTVIREVASVILSKRKPKSIADNGSQ